MKGIDIDPTNGRMTIINDTRTVATTEGTLVCLLPTVYSFLGQAVTFPDFQKDTAYLWTYETTSTLTPNQAGRYGESCGVYITAIPQEFSNKVTLMAAPAGADFFIGHVRLSRTTAPASTWQNETVSVLPIQNQWINMSGAFSTLVEAKWGMARAFHIYIDSSNNLVLERQQSVGTATGGYARFSSNNTGFTGGGRISATTTQGFPIALRAGQKSRGYFNYTNEIFIDFTYDRPGTGTGNTATASPCATSDTTNYTSVYTVDVVGRFGRRS